MNNKQCKKIRKYAKQFKKEWVLETERSIYRIVKKDYKKVPKNLRHQYMLDLSNDKIIIAQEKKI